MEFSSLNGLLSLSFALCFFLALFSMFMYYQNLKRTKNLPPGPWKLPLIGNMHQLIGGLPHHILRDLASKHGPLMQLKLGEIPIVVVTSPELAKEVMRTRDPIFAGRAKVQASKVMFYDNIDIASHTYDDYWKQMRRIFVHNMLSAKKVRSLTSVRLAEGKRMVTLVRNSAGKSVNISERISEYTMSVVCIAAFGRLCQDQDKFVALINKLTGLASGFQIADLFPSYSILRSMSSLMPKLLKIHGEVDTFFEGMINEHVHNLGSSERSGREDGQEDLMDILLKLKDNSSSLKFPITNSNMKAMIMDVFLAGSDTSSSSTIWAMSELVRNPHVMAKVQAEIREAFAGKETIDEADIHELKYLNHVVSETLRLHPPGPFLVPRECMEDCVVDGYIISAKTKVMINAWAIGRDPRYWPNPESFIPERFESNNIDFMGNNFEFIPFGSGRRICPGIALGIANMKLPLALLLHYFDWDIPGGIKAEFLDMSEKFGASLSRKNDLCLIPTLYSVFY